MEGPIDWKLMQLILTTSLTHSWTTNFIIISVISLSCAAAIDLGGHWHCCRERGSTGVKKLRGMIKDEQWTLKRLTH